MSRPRGTPRRADDGIVDDVAVDRVVTGDTMPLTDPERIEVSRRVDGSIDKTQELLHCGRSEAVQVAREARDTLPATTRPIPNPPAWWTPFAEVVTVFDNRETNLPVTYKAREPEQQAAPRLPNEPEPCECCGLRWGCGKEWAERNGISRGELRAIDQEIAQRAASISGTNGVDVDLRKHTTRGQDLPDNVVKLRRNLDDWRDEVERAPYVRLDGTIAA